MPRQNIETFNTADSRGSSTSNPLQDEVETARAARWAQANFNKLDADGNKELSKDELKADTYQEQQFVNQLKKNFKDVANTSKDENEGMFNRFWNGPVKQGITQTDLAINAQRDHGRDSGPYYPPNDSGAYDRGRRLFDNKNNANELEIVGHYTVKPGQGFDRIARDLIRHKDGVQNPSERDVVELSDRIAKMNGLNGRTDERARRLQAGSTIEIPAEYDPSTRRSRPVRPGTIHV
jgi:hypothetical protein